MKKSFFPSIAFAALLILPNAFAAISSEEATSHLLSQGYLKEGERPEIHPPVKVSHDEKSYWVATILVGDTPTGFVAVLDSVPPIVPTSPAINNPLFRTAFVLRGVYQIKSSLGNQWFFIASNQSFFQNLSQSFQKESENDLSLISSNDASINSQLQRMKSTLSSMQQQSNSLSDDLGKAISAENQFYLQPSTEKLNEFQEAYATVFSELDALQESIQAYDIDKTRLKALIAKSGASGEDKSFWVNLADAPNDMYSVKSKQSNAANNQQALDSVFSTAPIQAVTFTENLENRLQMVQAKNALYKEDSTLKDLIGKSVSLQQAANEILAAENEPQWKNQAEVQNLENYWKRALESFNGGNYALSVENASKAKSSARKVYQSGLKEPETAPNPIEQWIPAIIGLLVALLAVLFIVQRRKKILSMISPQPEGLEEQNYAYHFKV